MFLPINSNSHECEDAGRDSTRRDEEAELAVLSSKHPILVHVVKQVKRRVQKLNHYVSNRQIHQEVVGDRAHALMRQYDPDDDDVASSGDDEHGDEDDIEEELLPPGKDKEACRWRCGVA